MRFVAACLAFALVTACGPASAPSAHADTIVITSAWAPPTPGGVDVSAGYLIITNHGARDDALLAVSSPRASRVDLHAMSMDNGMMSMTAIERLTIPAGGEIALVPGGRHLMFYGVSAPFAADQEIPVRLRFEHAGEIETTLPVRARAAESHAGH